MQNLKIYSDNWMFFKCCKLDGLKKKLNNKLLVFYYSVTKAYGFMGTQVSYM